MIWTAEALLGWAIVVEDRLLLDEADAEVRIVDPAGVPARSWRVWIARGEAGRPVYWRQGVGRVRCDGGPSHPMLSMAQRRASYTLEGVVARARGCLQDVILARRQADAAAIA